MKIKSFLIFLCALSVSWNSPAAPIGRRQAMKLASRYVRLNANARLLQVESKEPQGDSPAYYVFNDADKKGFVIISGDDATIPVLGYGLEGQIDPNDLPEQLARLLAMHTRQVRSMRDAGLTPGVPTPTPKPNPQPVKGPLLQSLWDQNAPFNNQVPLIGSERAVTGCVATAMAQLMYYHKWPIRGTGAYSYYHNTGKLSVNFAESVYDWKNMLDEYAYEDSFGFDVSKGVPKWNDAQADAVAKLMSDAGIAIGTGYDLSNFGSGSNVAAAAKALREYFSYHTLTLYRDYTPNSKFLTAIKEELDRNYPILMVGSLVPSGHAWVVDGYDENGYLHVNWGWGGLSNGYFALGFMNPDNAGIGGVTGGYNQGQVIVLARPDKPGVEGFPNESRGCLYLLPNAGLRFHQDLTNLSQRRVGLKIERLSHKRNASYTPQIAIALCDDGGTRVQLTPYDGSLEGQFRNGMYKPILMSVSLPHNLPDGTYSLHTMYREAGKADEVWQEVGHEVPLYFSVRQGKVELPPASEQSDVSLRLIEKPKMLTPLWKGREASIQLSIANPTPFSTEFGEIVLRLKAGGKVHDMVVENFRFHDYGRYDGIVSVSSVRPAVLEAGLYDMELFFRRPGREYPIANPFGVYRLEVLESADKPILCLAHDYGSHNGSTRSLTLRKGEKEWTDELLRPDELDERGLVIEAVLTNRGSVPFVGTLSYVLVDPLTGDRQILATRPEQRIENNEYGFSLVTVEVPRSIMERIPPQRRYELHIFATIDGIERDVWDNGVYRRGLILTDSGVTSAAAGTMKETISYFPNPVHDYIVLRGVRAGEAIKIVALNGRIVREAVMPEAPELRLSLSGVSSGIYMIRSGEYASKFILR